MKSRSNVGSCWFAVAFALSAPVVWAGDGEDVELLVRFTGFGVADPARDSALVASYNADRQRPDAVPKAVEEVPATGTLPTTRRDRAAELRDEYRRKAALKREAALNREVEKAPAPVTPTKPTVLVNALPEGLDISANGLLEASKASGVEVLGSFSIRGLTAFDRLGYVMSRAFAQEFLVAETQRFTALAGGNVAVITFVQNIDEKQGFAHAVTGYIIRAEHFDQTKTRPGRVPTEI